jgi:uncharacterized protein (DUF1800 family)
MPGVNGRAREGTPVSIVNDSNSFTQTHRKGKEGAMEVSRRQLIQIGGTAAAAAVVPLGSGADLRPRPPLRWAARSASDMPEPDLPALLYNRAAFGPRPGDVEALRQQTPYDWIEQQLDYTSIDDSAVEDALKNLSTLSMPARQLIDFGMNLGQVVEELRLATLYRMIFSRRLLFEVMVEFWTDHFSIYLETDNVRYFKTVDDRDVIRKHALGKFKDLLTASAMSPAMLNYLNNDANFVNYPNENYAREIMELHTLGAATNGVPYTEQDVKEVAKCFTGWNWTRGNSPRRGEFEFVQLRHDNSYKTVLGNGIGPAGDLEDGKAVIEILCNHEATGRFLAAKLVRRFVTDDPQGQAPELVNRVAETYRNSQGDIKDMVYTILTSQEFARSFATYGGRLSRPADLLARALRAVDIKPEHLPARLPTGRPGGSQTGQNPVYNRLTYALRSMGHVPFDWPTPDGFPDTKEAWSSSIGMLVRWNFGLSLAAAGSGSTPLGGEFIPGFRPHEQMPADIATAGAAVDWWTDRLLHRPVLAADKTLLVGYLTNGGSAETLLDSASRRRLPELIALILDSAYFQWR